MSDEVNAELKFRTKAKPFYEKKTKLFSDKRPNYGYKKLADAAATAKQPSILDFVQRLSFPNTGHSDSVVIPEMFATKCVSSCSTWPPPPGGGSVAEVSANADWPPNRSIDEPDKCSVCGDDWPPGSSGHDHSATDIVVDWPPVNRPSDGVSCVEEPTESQEMVLDVPTQRNDDEGGGSSSPSNSFEGLPGWMPNSPGVTCGWDSPPTHRPMAQEGRQDDKLPVFRLRVWETWQLPKDALAGWDVGVSSQIGCEPTFAWYDPIEGCEKAIKTEPGREGFWRTTSAQIDFDSRGYTIWCLDKTDIRGRPWILLTTQREDSRPTCILCSVRHERVADSVATEHELPGGGRGYSYDRRVVEIQYQVDKAFQSTAAVHQWCKEALQDDDGRIAQAVLENIRHTYDGGFLRHVRRLFVRYVLNGRVQRSENDPMDESVPAREHDEPTTKGTSGPKTEKPPSDNSIEFHAGGVLPQSGSSGSDQTGYPKIEIPRGPFTLENGHKGTRRSARLARLRTDEEYHNSSIMPRPSSPKRLRLDKIIKVEPLSPVAECVFTFHGARG